MAHSYDRFNRDTLQPFIATLNRISRKVEFDHELKPQESTLLDIMSVFIKQYFKYTQDGQFNIKEVDDEEEKKINEELDKKKMDDEQLKYDEQTQMHVAMLKQLEDTFFLDTSVEYNAPVIDFIIDEINEEGEKEGEGKEGEGEEINKSEYDSLFAVSDDEPNIYESSWGAYGFESNYP